MNILLEVQLAKVIATAFLATCFLIMSLAWAAAASYNYIPKDNHRSKLKRYVPNVKHPTTAKTLRDFPEGTEIAILEIALLPVAQLVSDYVEGIRTGTFENTFWLDTRQRVKQNRTYRIESNKEEKWLFLKEYMMPIRQSI